MQRGGNLSLSGEPYSVATMSDSSSHKDELKRIARVADLMCTGHSVRASELTRSAIALDLLLLTTSAWLLAVSFTSNEIGQKLSPFGIEPWLWVGLLGFATFVLSLVQLKVNLKGHADAHKRSFEVYAEVKRNVRYLLANDHLAEDEVVAAYARYDMACATAVQITDQDFLRVKRMHRTKVEMSKILDERPFASVLLQSVKLWWRDNKSS